MNRHIIHILAAMIAMAAATALSDAAPARRGPITLRQPDGYSFTAVLRGDEFGHILKTMDGCAIIQDEDGYYCYAVFDADGSRHSSGQAVRYRTGRLQHSPRQTGWRYRTSMRSR